MPNQGKQSDDYVSRRRFVQAAAAAGIAGVAGCGADGGDTPTATEGSGSDGSMATATPYEDQKKWLQEVSKPFDGQTITLVTESTPASLFYKDHTDEFKDLTGITVNFQDVAWGEMYNREVSAAVANEAGLDIGYLEQDALAAFAQKGWITNLDEFKQQNPELVMPNFDIDDFVPFAQNFRYPRADSPFYAYPMESFLKLRIHREDVYDQVSGQLSFDGYPSNPSQYEESAKVIDENTDMAGHAAQVTGVTGPYAMVESYFPLFGVYNWGLNTDKWTALETRGGSLNSDAAVKGLKHYKKLLQYAPDGVRSYSFSGVADAVTASQAAQGMTYAENFGSMVRADKDYESSVLDAELPWAKQSTMEAAKNDNGYIGYYDGGGWAIMAPSKKKKAAFLFIQYVTRKEMAKDLAAETGAVVRNSALQSVKDGTINNATGYFDIYEQQASLFNGNPVGEVQKAMIEGPIFNNFHEFIADNMSAREAANEMAWQAEQLLNQMGYLGSTLDEKPF
ncbi:MAG: ABC transporter substrate-binding protein [Halobacteriales archaeon]